VAVAPLERDEFTSLLTLEGARDGFEAEVLVGTTRALVRGQTRADHAAEIADLLAKLGVGSDVEIIFGEDRSEFAREGSRLSYRLE
jgi:hypothetical protein